MCFVGTVEGSEKSIVVTPAVTTCSIDAAHAVVVLLEALPREMEERGPLNITLTPLARRLQ